MRSLSKSNKTLKISNNNKINKSNENRFSLFFQFHKRIKFLSICEVYWSKQAFCFGLLVSLKLWVSFMDCSRWLYIWFTMKTHIIFIFCIPMFHGLFLELMKHFLEVCYGWLCDMLSTFSFLCWCWDTVKVFVSIQGHMSW